MTETTESTAPRTPKKWNMRIPFPTDYFLCEVLEASFNPSKKSGNPMITLELETRSPETYEIGELYITTSGVPVKYYLVVQTIKDGQVDPVKTAENKDNIKSFFDKCGLDFSAFDPENPDLSVFRGLKIWMLLKPKREEKRKEPTFAQKQRGELGDLLIDPKTGEKQITYYPQVEDVSGVVTE